MALPVTDSRLDELLTNVRLSMNTEHELAWNLANAKADTGQDLIELEAYCNSLGLKRQDMMNALKEDALYFEYEVLTDESMLNRRRMFRLRRDHPDHAHALLMLGVSQQKSLVELSDDRIGEFVACGIPLPGNKSVPLAEASKLQVRDAVREAWKTTSSQPVKIPTPEPPKPSPNPRVVKVMTALHALTFLTLEQAEDILLAVATRLVFDPTATRRTTRRMIEASFEVGYLKDKVPMMKAVKVLQALPQYFANVDLTRTLPCEARAIACHLLTPVIAAVAEWCPPERAEAG